MYHIYPLKTDNLPCKLNNCRRLCRFYLNFVILKRLGDVSMSRLPQANQPEETSAELCCRYLKPIYLTLTFVKVPIIKELCNVRTLSSSLHADKPQTVYIKQTTVQSICVEITLVSVGGLYVKVYFVCFIDVSIRLLLADTNFRFFFAFQYIYTKQKTGAACSLITTGSSESARI